MRSVSVKLAALDNGFLSKFVILFFCFQKLMYTFAAYFSYAENDSKNSP